MFKSALWIASKNILRARLWICITLAIVFISSFFVNWVNIISIASQKDSFTHIYIITIFIVAYSGIFGIVSLVYKLRADEFGVLKAMGASNMFILLTIFLELLLIIIFPTIVSILTGFVFFNWLIEYQITFKLILLSSIKIATFNLIASIVFSIFPSIYIMRVNIESVVRGEY